MIIKMHQVDVKLPDMYQLMSAIRVDVMGLFYPLNLIDSKKMEELRSKDKNLRGTPVYGCLYDNKFSFWPIPDKDYKVMFRYLPPPVEV
jgi:hypothetical protein